MAGAPYLITHMINVLLLSVFIMAMIAPRRLCESALYPQAPNKPLPTFFWVFAVRELVLGLIMLILQFHGEWRAVAVVVGCISLNGITDFWFCAMEVGFDESVKSKGKVNMWWASFKAHGIPTIVGLWAATRLWQEHW